MTTTTNSSSDNDAPPHLINIPYEQLTSLTSSLASLALSASSLSAQLANTRIAARNRHRSEAFFEEKMRHGGGAGADGRGHYSEVTARMLVWCYLTFEPLRKTV